MQQDTIENILNNLGAEDVAYTGNNFVMACCLHTEKHNDTRRSMRVHATDDGSPSVYSCASCDSKGTVTQLIKRMQVLHNKDYSKLIKYAESEDDKYYVSDWNEAIKKNSDKLVFKCSPAKPNKRFVDLVDFDNRKVARENIEAVKYIRKRNISWEAIHKAKLLYDPYEKRIVFPVMQYDQICYGYTSRSIVKDEDFPLRKVKATKQWDYGNVHSEEDTCPATYTDKKGKVRVSDYMKIRDYHPIKKSELIIGMHLWKKNLPVFIVEGLFGYLHLLSIGADEHFNIGATMGANLSDHQAHRLKVFCKPTKVKPFGIPTYLLFDNDPAGRMALLGTEKSEGAIDKLSNSVITCVPKWPLVKDKDLIDKLIPLFLKIENCDSYLEKDNLNDVILRKVLKTLKKLKKLVDGYTISRGKIYKADPDKLTIEEILYMKEYSEIV